MKAMKKVLRILAWVSLALVLSLVFHPLWIGPTAKALAPSIVAGITKTRFAVDYIGLNLYTGRIAVDGVVVENPRHFFEKSEEKAQEVSKKEETKNALFSIAKGLAQESSKGVGKALSAVGEVLSPCGTNAVTLGSVAVDISMFDTLTGSVHVREVCIDGLSIFGDTTFSNLREIADNASGEDEKEESKAKEAADEASETKVVIDRVLLTNAKIKWGNITIPLPNVEVRDIGKSSEGSTCEDAFDMILDAVCDASDTVCAGSGKALKLAIEGGSKIGESVKFVKGLFK